ncbi:Crp/Fnr family transcriptional regulator [Lagierella massiliensis]|uniref:Crp/Fnr family transcriptional regulator n=1 Tax=Lagierella massiliensis TaxID=1689303 RepID=UPI0006D7EDA0|nr:Crp/Fnr family transcriptional regulator [Lagierella massiliensis]
MDLLDFKIFKGISEDSKNAIMDINPQIYYYEPKNISIRNDETLKYVLLIKKGCLKTTEYMINGKEIVSSYYSEGDAFPFYLHYGNYTNFPYDVYAVKKSEVYFVPFDELEPIIDKDPILMKNVLAFVSEYLCFNKFVLRATQYYKINQRIAYWLLHIDEIDSLKLPKTQEMLADLLRVNRSCLNTELKYMESEGIIKVNGVNIKVLRPDLLEDLI